MTDLSFEPYIFEAEAHVNGSVTWSEADLMKRLEYGPGERDKFKRARLKAMQACIAMGADPAGEFISDEHGNRFTRFACYLIAMAADSKRRAVADVQVYLATIAEIVRETYDQAGDVDRLVLRHEVTGGMKSLATTAKAHGVTNYGRFNDAGYRGLYNMSIRDLEEKKGLAFGDQLLDRMGRTELAANFLRVTLTEERIRTEAIRGQASLEQAAEAVGKSVRQTVIDNSGKAPEDLPLAEHISDTRKRVKATRKKLKELSTPKANRELQERFVKEHHLIVDPSELGFTPDPEEEVDTLEDDGLDEDE